MCVCVFVWRPRKTSHIDKKSFVFKKWKSTLFTYPVLFTVFKYSH